MNKYSVLQWCFTAQKLKPWDHILIFAFSRLFRKEFSSGIGINYLDPLYLVKHLNLPHIPKIVAPLMSLKFFKEQLNQKTGVYIILDKTTGECYIGSAVDLTRRVGVHMANATQTGNTNVHLFRAMKAHGKNNFILIIPEILGDQGTISGKTLTNREQVYLDCVPTKLKFNIQPIAGGHFPAKPFFSDRSKDLMSEKKKGLRRTPESIAAGSESSKRYLEVIDLKTGAVNYCLGRKEAAKLIGGNEASIGRALRSDNIHAGKHKITLVQQDIEGNYHPATLAKRDNSLVNVFNIKTNENKLFTSRGAAAEFANCRLLAVRKAIAEGAILKETYKFCLVERNEANLRLIKE